MYPILQPYQNQLQSLQNQMLTPNPTPTLQYVNGRASVDNYTMQPNTSVILMDSTKDTFYIKRADASGSCTVEAFDFHKSEDETKNEYVTRAEFDEIKKTLDKVVEEFGIESKEEA